LVILSIIFRSFLGGGSNIIVNPEGYWKLGKIIAKSLLFIFYYNSLHISRKSFYPAL
jgi:hypothetical protein